MPSKHLKVRDSFNSQSESKTVIKAKRPAPYSLRLSDSERAYLKSKAGKLSVHAYIRARIFDDDAPVPSNRKQPRVSDMQALSKVLGGLGRSKIANNLNQIAKAINNGALVVPDGIAQDLSDAVFQIAEMRSDLIKALGLREKQR